MLVKFVIDEPCETTWPLIRLTSVFVALNAEAFAAIPSLAIAKELSKVSTRDAVAALLVTAVLAVVCAVAAFVSACPVFVSTSLRSDLNWLIEEPWATTSPLIRVTSVLVVLIAEEFASIADWVSAIAGLHVVTLLPSSAW